MTPLAGRRAFLLALFVLSACGRNEVPKADGKHEAESAATKSKVPRVAVLSFGGRQSVSASSPETAVTLFNNRLTELGYVHGKTIVVEESYADGEAQKLTQLAREIVERKPDVIVAIAAA